MKLLAQVRASSPVAGPLRRALLSAAMSVVAAAAAPGGAGAQETSCPQAADGLAVRETAAFPSGGVTVRGLLYRPAAPNGAGIVLLPGARGMHAALPAFDPHAMRLASEGYHVLIPNYYDAHPLEEVRTARALRRWRGAALDGIEHLRSLDAVVDDRLTLWGYSLGGFIAVEAAMEGGAARAVAVAAGTDAGDPQRSRRDLPLLLIHGRSDAVISPASTRRWAANLRQRGAAVSVRELGLDGHALDEAGWCEVFGATQAWLNTPHGEASAGD